MNAIWAILLLGFVVFLGFLAFNYQSELSGNASRDFMVAQQYPTSALEQDSANESLFCKDCNVVLISIDALRADHLGAYGYKKNISPSIDALAEKGVKFLNFFANSYSTPFSEMAVHSGQYPTTNGLVDFTVSKTSDSPTLAQVLNLYGYKTAAFIASPEFGYPPLEQSFSKGFEQYVHTQHRGGGTGLPDTVFVRNWLEKNKNDQFFMWLAVGNVHWPYDAPHESKVSNYSGFFKDKKPDWSVFSRIYDSTYYPSNGVASAKLQKEDFEYLLQNYDESIGDADEFVGQIVELLGNYNLTDNTLIVIQSEHGESFGEHGSISHYDLYAEVLHAPFIIVAPKLKMENRAIGALAQGIDVMPTILDLLGAPIPHEVEGKSFLTVLAGSDEEPNEFIIAERTVLFEKMMVPDQNASQDGSSGVTGNPYGLDAVKDVWMPGHRSKEYLENEDISIQNNNYKLIWRKTHKWQEEISLWSTIRGKKIAIPEFELYDLTQDSGEQKNVYFEKQDIARELLLKLSEWWTKQRPKISNSSINNSLFYEYQ